MQLEPRAPIWARAAYAALSGRVLRGAETKLTIFNFHKVPREVSTLGPDELLLEEFAGILRVLLAHFNVVPLEVGIRNLGTGGMPPFAAAITFDDGYPDWFTGVVPLLKAHSVPATFFITTCQLEGKPLWFERLYRALNACSADLSRLAPLLSEHAIEHQRAPGETFQSVVQSVKYLPTLTRDAFIADCEALSGIEPMLARFTAEDVRTLHQSGFGIGAHTVNHPILSLCSDDEARREIVQSKETLETVIGGAISLFAYPNGVPGIDIKESHVRQVRQAGFNAAVTTALGAAGPRTSVYQLPRFSPWAKTPRRLLIQYLMTMNRRFSVIEEGDMS